MSINTTLAGLSQSAGANGPDGTSDAPSTLDDAIRYALSFVAQLRDGAHEYATGIAGSNTITGTIATNPTAYVTGREYRFVAAAANTGAATLNLNSLGAKAITKNGAAALTGGEIASGQAVTVVYDGTQFQLVSVAQPGSLAANGYQQFASGLIVQWGTANGVTTAGVSVTFPLAFPTSILAAAGAVSDPSSSAAFATSIGSKTSMTVRTSSSSGLSVTWIALGY